MLKLNYRYLNIKSILIFISLGWCFYFPSKLIEVYYLIGISFFLMPFVFNDKVKINTQIKVIFGILLIAVLFQILRLVIAQDSLRDLSEVARLVFLLTCAAFFSHINEKNQALIFYLIGIYLILNFLVSWLQFYNLSIVDGLTKIYGGENHIEYSLGMSSRALGLSAGPGQNGATSSILGIYAFCILYFFYKKVALSFFIAALAFITVLLSQSQTSFISLCVGMILVLTGGKIFLPKSEKFSVYYIIFISAALAIIFYYLLNELDYLNSLFTYGLERGSYQARELKWSEFFDHANEVPWLYFFGHGKSYFGASSGAMDNEYLFILMIYGVFVFLVVYGLIFWSLIVAYRDIKRGSTKALAYAGVVVCGLISAWPNTFLLDGRTAIIFLIALAFWQDEKNMHIKG